MQCDGKTQKKTIKATINWKPNVNWDLQETDLKSVLEGYSKMWHGAIIDITNWV